MKKQRIGSKRTTHSKSKWQRRWLRRQHLPPWWPLPSELIAALPCLAFLLAPPPGPFPSNMSHSQVYPCSWLEWMDTKKKDKTKQIPIEKDRCQLLHKCCSLACKFDSLLLVNVTWKREPSTLFNFPKAALIIGGSFSFAKAALKGINLAWIVNFYSKHSIFFVEFPARAMPF